MKLLIHKSGKEFLVAGDKDYHCQFGMISKKDFSKSLVETNSGEELYCIDASFVDEFKRIKRGAQIILLKDLGVILTELGVNKDSVVVDVGTGSAACAIFMSKIAKKVHTFEKNEKHLAVATKNIEKLGCKNVVSKQLDIYSEKPKIKDADAAIIDLLEPWKAISNVASCLKKGALIAIYNPHITQNKKLVEELPSNLIHLRTLETIQREWDISGKLCRPRFGEISHTAFITILRKV